jgi:hypothetical protein
MREPKKPKITKADLSLQKKIGTGTVEEKLIKKCQDVMDRNEVDFGPMALELLDKLDKAVKEAKKGGKPQKEAIQDIVTPVMQLKANAATFKYDLISNLANVMLSFLEAIKDLDKTVIEIVEAHQKTLSVIVMKKMAGNGGDAGKLLEDELKGACKRYFTKKS